MADLMSKIMIAKAEQQGLKLLGEKYKGLKNCNVCGKEFEFITDNPYITLYICSSKCDELYYTQARNCKFCGKEFKYNSKGKGFLDIPRYCSIKCEEKVKENEHQEWVKEQIKIQLPLKYHNLETDKIKLLKESMGKSLFLWGKVGTGKSVFMASLAKEYLKKNTGIKWISFPSFIMKLQNAFRQSEHCYDKETPYEIAEDIAKYKNVLFIDDLGAEKLTEFVRQIMYYIINEREERMLRTIITSNFSLNEIDEYIANRISSRIAGMCEVLKFTGKDRRIPT